MSAAALPSPEGPSMDTLQGDDPPEAPMQMTLERSLVRAALDSLGRRARERPLTPRAREAAQHLDEALAHLDEEARRELELLDAAPGAVTEVGSCP